jgi:putative ABC transport system substrate-binding protein
MPVIGFLNTRAPSEDAQLLAAFRQGLTETGYVEGRNVAIEYRWAEGHSDRLSALATDLVRRQVPDTADIKEAPGVPGLQVVSNKGEWPRGMSL